MTKTTVATKKTPSHPPYAELIKAGILSLKDRNGSSRQSLKKYIKTNYNIIASNFDALFNAALRKGVEKGDFVQPKGTSGPIKLNKKKLEAKPVVKKATPAKKSTSVKKTTPKAKAANITTNTNTTAATVTAKKVTVKKAATPKSTLAKKNTLKKKTTTTPKVTKKVSTKKASTATKKAAPAKKAAPKKKAVVKK